LGAHQGNKLGITITDWKAGSKERRRALLYRIRSFVQRLSFKNSLKSVALVAVATLFSALAFGFVPDASLTLVYLMAIVISAQRYGLWQAVFASLIAILAWDYFFTQPYFSLEVSSRRDVFTLIFFMIVALIVSGMNAHIRRQNFHLSHLASQNARLYAFIQGLGIIDTVEEIAAYTVPYISSLLERDVIMILDSHDTGGGKTIFPRGALGDRHEAPTNQELAAELHLSETEQSLIMRDNVYIPLIALRGRIGVIKVPDSLQKPISREQRQQVWAILSPAAIAIERIWLAKEHELIGIAAETERIRNALLISVSHDLKTPLTTIIGSLTTLELLVNQDGDNDQTEMASLALSEAQRLDRFITNLLDMTRLEFGGLNVKLFPVDIGDAVISALQRAQSLLQEHRIVVHIQDRLPPANANWDLLQQALFNIIDNAGKYSPLHSQIEIRTRSNGGEIVIEIIDQGEGFGDQPPIKLFNKFSRLSLGDAKPPGTGLGLAIAKGFIEAMGGTIKAANRSDHHGAIFTIGLPVVISLPEALSDR
jgi:two-component system sensor histidine kinase KdpD